MNVFDTILYKTIRGILCFTTTVLFRVEKDGEENIEKGVPYLLCSNHKSNWDPIILETHTKRKIYFMAKSELFKNPFLNKLGYLFGAISVKRGHQDMDAIKTSLKVLKNNDILGVFPEGTRNGIAKKVKVKTGSAFLAVRAGVKVIPVGIEGNYKPFHKIKVHYGKPLDFSEYYGTKPDKETLEKISEDIMNSIIMLTNQEK